MVNSDRKASPRTTVRLGSFMDKLLAGYGLQHELGGWRAVLYWPKVVGETMAEHSRAVRFAEGTLYVSVGDPSWRQEMALTSDRILQEIHKLPGGRAVKKIQFIS